MKALFSLTAIFAAAVALASGSIKITADSQMAVADGRSVVILTAVIRNSGGSLVPDGTSVRFTTNSGYFREAEVLTTGGAARAELVAPNFEGVATITVSAPTVGTIETYEFEFVKDRSMLVAAHQYVDIESSEYLAFHAGIQIISASGRDNPAILKYRDITILSRDMQFDIARMQVIARSAELTVAGETIRTNLLKYSLNRRRGTANMTHQERMGFYNLTAAHPAIAETGQPPREFEFADVGISTQSVLADRMVIFPNREIQFYRPKMYVGDTKVMSLPLYAMRPSAESSVLGDQVISYNNGGVILNYPYYLKLSPQHTSLVRLRSGYDGGRGSASSRGIFIDWENNYLAGDSGQGSVSLTGIARNDMGLNWRHTHRFGDRTTANASLDFPGFKSIYGSMNAQTAFNGFSLNVLGMSSRTLRGTPFESQRFDVSLETDMKRIESLPLMYSFGITANSSRASIAGLTTKQDGVGWRSRFVYVPMRLWDGATLTGSTTITQLWNRQVSGRFGMLSTLSVSTPLTSQSALQLSYDFVQDALTQALFGKHRISGMLSWDAQRFNMSVYAGKSLDFDSSTVFFDGSYLIDKKWRIGASLSMDRYQGQSIIDQTLIVGYTIGTREFGVTYNAQSGKFGVTLLNAPLR